MLDGNISMLSFLPNFQDLSETFKMSDINTARLPFVYLFIILIFPPYIGDDVNHTLTRGDG